MEEPVWLRKQEKPAGCGSRRTGLAAEAGEPGWLRKQEKPAGPAEGGGQPDCLWKKLWKKRKLCGKSQEIRACLWIREEQPGKEVKTGGEIRRTFLTVSGYNGILSLSETFWILFTEH